MGIVVSDTDKLGGRGWSRWCPVGGAIHYYHLPLRHLELSTGYPLVFIIDADIM